MLQDFRHQVVVVGFGDLAAVELAGLRVDFLGEVVDEDFAVDFGGVHWRAAFEQQFGFFRLAFEQQIEFAPDQRLSFSFC